VTLVEYLFRVLVYLLAFTGIGVTIFLASEWLKSSNRGSADAGEPTTMNREPPSYSESDPSGPFGWPIIGSALASRCTLTFLLGNRRDYGDIAHSVFLDESIYQPNHHDDIEWILVENNQAVTEFRLVTPSVNHVTGPYRTTSAVPHESGES
jgi:hypothetical protein